MHRSVLITGASSGIGFETALYLAEKGFRVYATARDPQKSEGLEKEAEARKVRLRVLQLDVTRPHEVNNAVQTVIRETGGIYGLVNNAGIAKHAFFEDLSREEVRSVFETNVFGTMEVTRVALPHMRSAGGGRILIVSSIAGRIAGVAASAYCASKFALEGFAESLQQETSLFGVSIALIEPGIIRTKIWENGLDEGAGETGSTGPYSAMFERQRMLVGKLLDASSNTPLEVAKSIYRALTDARPRLRYVVGFKAKMMLRLRKCLPGELFERIYFRQVTRMIGGS